MVKNVFKKRETRDHCFVLQEIWDWGLTMDYFGKENPYFPPAINYISDGADELWTNVRALKWFMDGLLLKNKRNEKFLLGIVAEHEKTSRELIEISKKKYLKSIAELNDFLKLIKKGTYTFLAFYYSAVDKRTPRKLRKMALQSQGKRCLLRQRRSSHQKNN